MTTAQIGIRSGNVIVPYVSTTKRTKEIDMGAYVASNKTGDANVRCVAIFYADSAGKWRMGFNFLRSFTSTTVSFAYLTITNVKIKNTAGFEQAVTPYLLPDIAARIAYASPTTSGNNGVITVQYSAGATANITGIGASGDIELEEEPTAYTTAANMEGVIAADVYIAPASATSAGLVSAQAQTFAGNKTLTEFTSLGSGNSGLKCKVVSGTTAAAAGGSTTVLHGLDGDKIMTMSAIVRFTSGQGVAPTYTSAAGYQFDLAHTATNAVIYNHATNSENILSKTFYIMLWYIE